MKRQKKPAESKTSPKPARRNPPTAKAQAAEAAESTRSKEVLSQTRNAKTEAAPTEPPAAKQEKTEPISAKAPSIAKATPAAAQGLARSKPAGKPGAPRKAKTAKQPPLKIPPILLEGDLPPAPKAAGPGARYALGAPATHAKAGAPEIPGSITAAGELPESYGTGRLFLAARDPRWLYASWDLALEQQRASNQRSRDGHLVLRIYANDELTPVVPDVHLNPESRNFFINVPRPETRYWAELGFYTRTGNWVQITKSQNTFTPPDAPAPEAVAEFATIPVEVSFAQVVKTVQEFVTEHQPLLEAVIAAQQAQEQEAAIVAPPSTHPVAPQFEIPRPHPGERVPAQNGAERKTSEFVQRSEVMRAEPTKRSRSARTEIPIRVERAEPWTPERRETLARLISIDSYRRVWMGSIEITELVRRQLQEEVASIAAAELGRLAGERAPGAPLLNISSPPGGEVPRRGRKFWFKVNAELIIYGATEPDARVTIADRLVKLRPDGTFSFRFALPDGKYGLPASATSADGVESREAALEFSRSTEYRGHVEPHPQDSALRSPCPGNL